MEDFSFLTANTSAKLSPSNLFAEPVKNISEETPGMVFLQQNSLKGIIPPVMITSRTLGTLIESTGFDPENGKSITEYIVESGDTISSLAAKFNVSVNTILWANDLSKSSVVKRGQKLIIPPVSGVIYHVKKGDTLSAVAETYKGKVDEIIAFNELSGEGDVFVGDIIVIPNGRIPVSTKTKTYTTTKPAQVPIGSSYFICPTSSCRISQGLHWHNAIDFNEPCGSPIYAAAGGTVQRVKYGWNYGAGNYLTILHPNGVVTMYGHISSSLVKPGQQVSQGQRIALIGGKPGTSGAGISTGCHVHFGVEGAKNPFAR